MTRKVNNLFRKLVKVLKKVRRKDFLLTVQLKNNREVKQKQVEICTVH